MSNLLLEVQGFYIFGRFIAWYGVIIALGMLLGLISACVVCKDKGYNRNMPINIAIYAIPLAILGARLYYCIFTDTNTFSHFFDISQGGMAIYGGVIGGFLGLVICCLIHKYSILQACDVAVPSLILGQAIGRIGCYFSGCCYGVETTIESLKVFPISTIQDDGLWHYATFFYESVLNLITYVILMVLTYTTDKRGIATGSYLVEYGIIRAVLEQFRDPKESLELIQGSGIRVSQLLSIILIVIGVCTIILVNIKKNKEAKVNE